MSFEPIITSLLDTDLYKITMQAAVLDNYPEASMCNALTQHN